MRDVAAADVAAFNPAFGWLNALRAPISGALRGGVDAEGKFSPVNATLQIKKGVLQPTSETRPIPFDSARTYFTFDPLTSQLVFDELSIDSAWGKGRAEGRASLRGLETGTLEQLVGQVQVSDMVINPPDVYEQPVELDGAEIDFRLIPQPFRFDLGQMRVADQGKSLRLEGVLEAAPEGWQLALDGQMDAVTPARLLELWPSAAAAPTRNWLAANLLDADLSALDFALRARPGSKPDTYFSFAFDDARVRFMKTMPPVTQGKGVASLLRGRFALGIEQGNLQAPQGGRIDVGGSAFIIPDVTVKGGAPAVVRLRTDSTITGLLSLLDRPPLQILTRADLPVTLADGRAEASATLLLPLKPALSTEEVRYEVEGVMRNVSSQTLVPGRKITAPELSVQASNMTDTPGIEIAGKGQFDGIPFDATWAQAIGSEAETGSRVTGGVELSAAAAETLKLGLPPGSIRGSGPGEISIDLPRDAPPRFDLSSNLSGLGLNIAPLGWSMDPATTGQLRVSGVLGETPDVDRLELAGPGLSAVGRVALRAGGGLNEAQFSRVRVGQWLDAPVTLTGRGAGAAPAVQVRGGTLDLRATDFGEGGGNNDSGPVRLTLDRLQITDTIALTGMRGDFDLRRGLQGGFTGKVNGQADVTGEVVPQGGRSAFRIQSDNAGAVFAAAGLLKQARGGTMNLVLTPVGTAGAFNGSLAIQNTRVKDAPAIAALFNALSVVGLLEQMSGQGLHFAEVEAAFRLTPDRVTLTQASAVGPSIGLSMDGTYDVNSSQMDMRGVFSPIYLINGVGSVLTRRGEGLIGFNFRLTGPASGPRVQVNPLSALTPSIFREIFRRPPPEVAVEPGEAPGAAPKVLNRPERDPEPDLAPRAGDR